MKGLSIIRERRGIMALQSKQNAKTPLSDEMIIELYFKRDEKAIEETDHKYRRYLLSVAYNIIGDRLDCDECLNDTYLGAWGAMPPSRPRVLKAFLTTIIRRAAIKRYRSKSQKNTVPSEMTVSLSELEDFISDVGDVDADFDAVALGGIISDFVRSLTSRRQFIFISRYYAADPIGTIASELGLSRSTVNKELCAIRLALKEKLESEGYSI